MPEWKSSNVEGDLQGDLVACWQWCSWPEAKILVLSEAEILILELMHGCRYSGMIAWRGVVDGHRHPEILKALMEDFTNLDRAIIFDISSDYSMNLIYLLPDNRINWLWYRDAPEPTLLGQSVTVAATPDDIQKLHADAEANWTPAFVQLIKVGFPAIHSLYTSLHGSISSCCGRTLVCGSACPREMQLHTA